MPPLGLLPSLSNQDNKIRVNGKKDKVNGEEEKPDIPKAFFYFCRIFLLRRKIYQDEGGFILDNRDAENILSDFGSELETSVLKKLSYFEVNKIQSLAEDSERRLKLYDKFCEDLALDNDSITIRNKFVRNFEKISSYGPFDIA